MASAAIFAGGLPKPPDVFTIIKNKALNKKVVSEFLSSKKSENRPRAQLFDNRCRAKWKITSQKKMLEF